MTSRQAAVDLKLQRVMQSQTPQPPAWLREDLRSLVGASAKNRFQDPGHLRSWERHDRIFHVILQMFQDWWLVIHDLPLFIGDEKGWMNIHWPSTTPFLGSTCQGSNFGDSPDLAQQCANFDSKFQFGVFDVYQIRMENKKSKMDFKFFYVEHLLHPPPGTTVLFILCVRFCQRFATGNAGWWSSARTTIVHDIFILLHVPECSWYMCLRT